MALSAGEEPAAENFIEDPVESSPEVPAEVTPAGSSSAFGRMLHWNAARTAQRRHRPGQGADIPQCRCCRILLPAG